MSIRFVTALILGALTAPLAAGQVPDDPGAPRVVFIVADGAGVAYWSAARIYGHDLAVGGFPVVGLVDPTSRLTPYPESASSATAFAIGEATFRHAVGVGPDSTRRRTVLEAAREAGMATGLVTTTDVVDATPAAFAAHVTSRDSIDGIARQMVDYPMDVLLGDEVEAFDPAHRRDGRDLVGELARTHAMVRTTEALTRAREDPPHRLAGFFAIESVHDAANRSPTLAEMASTALAVLDRNPRGFFLVVEHEHTDHRGHDNAALEVIIDEMVEVDRAVRAALEYRAEHPETLIVVTGDHETGGLSVLVESDGYRAGWTTTSHTAELVPVFAIGPGAERFAGILTSAEVGRALFASIGADPAADPEPTDRP